MTCSCFVTVSTNTVKLCEGKGREGLGHNRSMAAIQTSNKVSEVTKKDSCLTTGSTVTGTQGGKERRKYVDDKNSCQCWCDVILCYATTLTTKRWPALFFFLVFFFAVDFYFSCSSTWTHIILSNASHLSSTYAFRPSRSVIGRKSQNSSHNAECNHQFPDVREKK